MNLANKYRPKNFDEHIGQAHIVKALKKALKEKKISNAYLFAGPRGVGKTTTARILAKALNCESSNDISENPCGNCQSCKDIENSKFIDVIEIDGASNRGIDEARQIRENARFLPARGRYKVYIIDEVHMLTMEAFNALLKTLEEPPQRVVFICATTDPQKVPPTVLSRLQRYDFSPIATYEIIQKLNEITKLENIEIEEMAINEIARRSEGSLREAIKFLEQAWMFSEGKITYHNVLDIFGAIDRDSLENLLKSIINRDTSRVIKVLDDILLKKTNVIDFCREFNQFLSDVLKEVILNKRKDIGKEDILQIINLALEMENHVKLSSTPKFIIEFYITKMCYIPKTIDIAKILENLNVVYKQEEKKQTSKINIKEEILNHLQETNKILAGYLSSAEFVEEKEKIKLIFNNEMAFDYVEKNLDNLKKTIELLGYHYEITLENKKSNETKIKLIKELNLEKFNGGDY